MLDPQGQSYSRDEAADLIELATELQRLTDAGAPQTDANLSYPDLVRIAAEFGVTESELSRAISQRGDVSKARAKGAKRQRRQLRRAWMYRAHWAAYGSTIGGLTIIDLLADPGIDFVMYPAAGWGIALAFHTWYFLDRRKATERTTA